TDRNKIKVCEGPCCREAGSDQLAELLASELGRSIERQHCMGSCQNAPAAMVDGEVITNVTLAKVRLLLK
ncbi:MAG TPA: NAD(P)H-dependent oxidoreductase subunit E, partial [Mariprofundaceae bacterium]|nr:NAD(P)H-dependent oxidoreductase subunit E [Mariprofundaceae bacterium]